MIKIAIEVVEILKVKLNSHILIPINIDFNFCTPDAFECFIISDDFPKSIWFGDILWFGCSISIQWNYSSHSPYFTNVRKFAFLFDLCYKVGWYSWGIQKHRDLQLSFVAWRLMWAHLHWLRSSAWKIVKKLFAANCMVPSTFEVS